MSQGWAGRDQGPFKAHPPQRVKGAKKNDMTRTQHVRSPPVSRSQPARSQPAARSWPARSPLAARPQLTRVFNLSLYDQNPIFTKQKI